MDVLLPTFHRHLRRYMTHLLVEKNASPYTVRNYRREIEEFLRFLVSERVYSPDDLNRSTLRRYLLWLEARGLAKASIARRVYELRAFFDYMIQEGGLPSNPLDLISSPKVPKRLPRFLTLQEIKVLLEAPDESTPLGQRDKAILELLYASGIRLGELVRLEAEGVDVRRGEFLVYGKGRKERVALMGEPARKALEKYLRRGGLSCWGRRGAMPYSSTASEGLSRCDGSSRSWIVTLSRQG